jgi:cytochrome c oxidase subunit 2
VSLRSKRRRLKTLEQEEQRNRFQRDQRSIRRRSRGESTSMRSDIMGGSLLFANAGRAPENLSIFDPASPAGISIRDLALVVFVVTGLIFLIVESVLIYSIIRFRRQTSTTTSEPPQVYGSHAIEIAWTVVPALIVFILTLLVARTEWDVRPTIPSPKAGDNALYVTVIGRQWWWEYRYEYFNGEKLDFVTANELYIPASDTDKSGTQRPVYLTLQSADVCHSFWVPRLGGKTDLIPGRTNKMWLQTAERGLFLGQCAEFCGTQHAKMLLRVQVEELADFEKWYKNQQRDARTPDQDATRQGQETFLKQSCVNCHRVGGTSAKGTYAPDLTHLMSRRTLASGILPNTQENLRDWVVDPQKIKPGCLMPAFGLSQNDVAQIVEYLRTLE